MFACFRLFLSTSLRLASATVVIKHASTTPAIFVTNLTPAAVTAYSLGSSGNIAPLASRTGLSLPEGVARDSSGKLYVANEAVASVTVYASGTNGNSSPISTIAGANTGLISPTGIALDSKGNIYVANAGSLGAGSDGIIEYAARSNGNVTPTAIITGSSTGLADPRAIALDSTGNIYVANSGSQITGVDSVTVYPAGSNGNAAPKATITGTSTRLKVPYGIAVGFGNIYVANDGSTARTSDSVTVYTVGSHGNVAPSATITGSNTMLESPGGIAIDSGGNIYVTDDGGIYGHGRRDKITVYSPGSNGNVQPSNLLFSKSLKSPLGIAVDSSGNLYVSNDGSTEGGVDTITVYPPNNMSASATIGSDTELNKASGITVDSGGNIYVTNQGSTVGGSDSVKIYPPGSYANVAPNATIAGSNTGLMLPFGIATNSSGSFFVANSAGGPDGMGSVTVYPTRSKGNVAPSATIAGNSSSDNTGFNMPTGIVLDSSGNLYVANVSGGPDNVGSITIYAKGSNGNVTPKATISDSPSCAPCDDTLLASPYGVALDSAGNIYVANSEGGPDGMGSVNVYPPLGSSTGILNEAPSAMITGNSSSDKTGFEFPSGLAVDSSANIYVANNGSPNGVTDSVTVYSAGSNGNVAPSATIAGSSTGLGAPQGIAIGPIGGLQSGVQRPGRRHSR
jgi:sugar lactone lactonase YvrE